MLLPQAAGASAPLLATLMPSLAPQHMSDTLYWGCVGMGGEGRLLAKAGWMQTWPARVLLHVALLACFQMQMQTTPADMAGRCCACPRLIALTKAMAPLPPAAASLLTTLVCTARFIISL